MNWREQSLQRFSGAELDKARRNLARFCDRLGPKASAEFREQLEISGAGDDPKVIQALLHGQTPSIPGMANPLAGAGRR